MTPRSATAAMFFINGALMGTWAAHIPFVRDEFALSNSSIGLCLLALAAGALVAMPATGLAEATSLRSALAMIAVLYGVIAITAGAAFAGGKRAPGRLTAYASHR
jgi:hydrogenase/urease accessory protein HupE